MSEDDAEPADLIGTAWGAEVIEDGLPDQARPTVYFGADGRITGNGGVNRFTGSYRIHGDSIEFGVIATTRMAGPEPAMRREQEILSALSGTQRFSVTDDLLAIGDGPDHLRLRRLGESG